MVGYSNQANSPEQKDGLQIHNNDGKLHGMLVGSKQSATQTQGAAQRHTSDEAHV